jgi:hypothetical protein
MRLERDELQVTGDADRVTLQIGRARLVLDEGQVRWLAALAFPTLLASPRETAEADA